MEELMQKIETMNCPRRDRTASEEHGGVQTFMEVKDEELVEVQLRGNNLLELILSPWNLNAAYRQVVKNGGAGGVDKMETSELLPYLKLHRDELIEKLRNCKYRPNPVKRGEIPKDNGKTRPLGIPTVVDRFIQQLISQILIPLYEPQFSNNSFGFRPHRSVHDALRRVQKYADQGYRYCIGLDLEKFFDKVNHSKLIEVLSRTVKDGRVVSLIHKYLNAGVLVSHKYEETREGIPQRGPLSPMFVRYADDCLILVKSLRATERVRDSISEFIEKKLFLKVNKENTEVGSIVGKKYLGYTFY